MSSLRIVSRLACLSAACAIAVMGGAQSAKNYGTLFFNTRVGSFKIVGTPDVTPEGRVEMSFSGTVLLTGTPNVKVEGNVVREYSNQQRKKQAFHGKGRLVVDGSFESMQWFGRDLTARWTGLGILRLFGEFDKNLKTGEFWYSDNPDKRVWGNFGNTITNPETRPFNPRDVDPVRRNQPPKK